MASPVETEAKLLEQWCSFELLPHTVHVQRPVRVVSAYDAAQVKGAVQQVLDLCQQHGYGAVGFLSYEAAPAFEAAMNVHATPQCDGFPLAWFALYDSAVAAEHSPTAPPAQRPRFKVGEWVPDVSREEYDRSIQAVRQSIKDGDVYQINYTLRLKAPFSGDPSALACRLVQAQRCGYGAFLDTGRFAIASSSPELFFHWDQATGQITTRPMKGTRRRGLSSRADEAEVQALLDSEKDKAENLMIVDLLRNDLGRIAMPGSVHVRELFKVERYPTVLQMTTTVRGTTRPGTSLLDVLKALFPCGSITGAPKISAMRGIKALEQSQRHVYCGAILHIGPGGRSPITASVPIRTAVVDRSTGMVHYGVGGGVTWDSTPTGEYDEVLAKAAVLQAAVGAELAGNPVPLSPQQLHPSARSPGFRLLETMRWSAQAANTADGACKGGGTAGTTPLSCFLYLPGHLARLQSSALYFNFTMSMEAVRAALLAAHEKYRSSGACDQRVRLLVGAHGDVEVEASPLPGPGIGLAPWEATATPQEPLLCVLASEPTSSKNAMLYHKTTDRKVYDDARARWLAPAAPGEAPPFDVLLWNEDGLLQEFTIGNIVLDMPHGDGWQLVTPPVSAGLLPGVLRASALASGRVVERDVRVTELGQARALWLVNSVRGWVQAKLQER